MIKVKHVDAFLLLSEDWERQYRVEGSFASFELALAKAQQLGFEAVDEDEENIQFIIARLMAVSEEVPNFLINPQPDILVDEDEEEEAFNALNPVHLAPPPEVLRLNPVHPDLFALPQVGDGFRWGFEGGLADDFGRAMNPGANNILGAEIGQVNFDELEEFNNER